MENSKPHPQSRILALLSLALAFRSTCTSWVFFFKISNENPVLFLWDCPQANTILSHLSEAYYVTTARPLDGMLVPLRDTDSPVKMCQQPAIWPPTTKYLPLISHLSDLYSGWRPLQPRPLLPITNLPSNRALNNVLKSSD